MMEKNRIENIISDLKLSNKDINLVTISDTHLMNFSNYGKYNKEGVNSDLINKLEIMKEAAILADKIGGIFLHCGDLLDQRKPDGPSLFYASEFIKFLLGLENLKYFIIIGGNHEYDDAAAHFSSIKHLGLFVPKSRGLIATEKCFRACAYGTGTTIRFTCLPANQNIEGHVSFLIKQMSKIEERKDYEILLLHGGIQGADYGSMRAPDGISSKHIKKCSEIFDWTICGDFHKFQFVNNHKNVYYCGSHKQMNVGEEGDKRGYQVVVLNKNILHFIKSRAPTFKTLEVVPNHYIHPWLSDPVKYVKKIKGKIFLIKITGEPKDIDKLDFIKMKNELIKNGAEMVFKDINPIKESRNSTIIKKDLPLRSIIIKYVKNKDYSLTPKERNKHIKALMKYVLKTKKKG